MDDQRFLIILLLLLCFVIYFLISLSQYALRLVKVTRLENMSDINEVKAQKLLTILDNENQLSLSFVPVKLLLVIICVFLIMNLKLNSNTWIALLLGWLFIISFLEILPSAIIRKSPERYAMNLVSLIKGLLTILTPIYLILNGASYFFRLFFKPQKESDYDEQELLNIVDKAESEGSLEESESELIRRSIAFNDLDVYSILTPRVDVIALNYDWDLEKKKQVFQESGFSRLPVYKESIDTIIGVIHIKDFHQMLNHDLSFDEIIKPVVFTPTYYEVSKLLHQFQVNKSHLAVVVDEYGGTAGVVTMEDIIEELVGEIWDEHDDIEFDIQKITHTQYVVMGHTSLEDFFDTFDIEVEDNEYDSTSVGGWVMDEMVKIPKVGESFHFENLAITIIEADERRVYKIMVNIEEKEETE